MALKHHNYTRLVGILKISLPILALGVFGTVFLITAEDTFDSGFTFSQAEFNALESGSFLDNSKINGKTAKGDIFSLSADRIEPDSQEFQHITATNIISIFDFISGESAKIVADLAEVDLEADLLVFPVGAHITTSDGYEGTLSVLVANLDTGEISGEMIETDGPLGHISAESFHISDVKTGSGENRVLSFENSVKVILNIE